MQAKHHIGTYRLSQRGFDIKTVQLARRFVPSDWGGTETVILETSKRLITAGHGTEILCTLATADSDADLVCNVPVRRFPYFYPYIGLSREAKGLLDKKGGSPFSFALARALYAVPDLDLVHLHVGNRLGGIGRYTALKRRIPYVITLHGGAFDVPKKESNTWTAPAKGAIEWGKILGWWVGSRRVLRDAATILCVGSREQELCQDRFPDKRVIHLPNGVDPTRFAGGRGDRFRAKYDVSSDSFVVLTVARIDPQKNQLLPVRLLSDFRSVHPKVQLVLVGYIGNQAYNAELRQTAREAGVDEHLTIVPGIPAGSPELADAYKAADLFLLPSIHEPFGIVILEAWAAGAPVIASRVGGVCQLVTPGEDALTFDPSDEKDLLQSFKALARDPEKRRDLATTGMAKAVSRYHWDVITQNLIGIYDEAIKATRNRRASEKELET